MSKSISFRSYPFFILGVMFLFPGWVGEAAVAGEPIHPVQKQVAQAIDIRRITQKEEGAWEQKKMELSETYCALQSEEQVLQRAKTEIDEKLKMQRKIIANAERQAKESVRIKEEMQSCLEQILVRLEDFVKRDLPFLPGERCDRLASIREELISPDITVSEKYRRMMEALKIETEYGQDVEVYQDTIELDGQSVMVDILRLVRLSLFCRTPDGELVGNYDRVTGEWLLLSSTYHREVAKAMEMARRERTVDLVKLPIGRIEVP
jgi:hypothetical protein